MSIKVNAINKEEGHSFDKYCAFIDTDGDFYVIDEDHKYVSRIMYSGCVIRNIESFNTIEDFLEYEYDNCELVKAYTNGSEYEIIVNG